MKKLFILSFVICFTMCTPKPKTGDAIFADLDRPEKASLFDYFHSIELIPLETSSDILITGISKIIYHQDKGTRCRRIFLYSGFHDQFFF